MSRLSPTQIVDAAIQLVDTFPSEEIAAGIYALLLKNQDTRAFPLVRSALSEKFFSEGIAVVETAQRIPDDVLDAFLPEVQKIYPSVTSLTQRQDPALLGGIRVRYGREVIDGTTANAIRQLKAVLVKE